MSPTPSARQPGSTKAGGAPRTPGRKDTAKPAAREAAPASTSGLTLTEESALDAAIADLEGGSHIWAALTLTQRARVVRGVRRGVGAVAEEWVDAACRSKGITAEHPTAGEEWLGGPYGVLTMLDALASTMDALAAGRSPLDGVAIEPAPGGRVRVKAFPADGRDRLLLSGFSGEVWLEPGVTAEQARREAGLAQLDSGSRGGVDGENPGVGLVLGAGNVTSIPILDVFYELFAHNRVALLKVNPTQDALVPIFERALAALIEPGFLRIVRGGAATGAHLTAHAGFSHVHITGSATTFDAIVWGTGDDAAANRAAATPKLATPITAELGGVSPIIVVPGEWTAADLTYQAQHVATMRLVNAGHNCIAGQMVIVSSDWPQREAFLRELHAAYAAAPSRPVWYPRSDERLADVADAYPDAAWSAGRTRAIVEADASAGPDPVESIEYFAPVLGVVEVAGRGQEFLDAAVAHANERLTGTLGANVIIDPVTEAALGDGFERAIADLRYGAVAINTWTAFVFLSAPLTWGGFPGASLDDVSSGIGVVHNALLLDRVERSIGRGPFRPFPRAIGKDVFGRGVFTVLPTPPWFVNSRTGTAVCAGLTRYLIDGRIPGLVKTFAQAMRA